MKCHLSFPIYVFFTILVQFPSLKPHIYGEESNEFTNTKGQQVTVRVCETLQSTTDLLSIALDRNTKLHIFLRVQFMNH